MLAPTFEVTVNDAQRATRIMLPRVSRTFSLGIKILPHRLETAVRVGYLLCRIADTIEDDLCMLPQRKAELLDGFVDCFEDEAVAEAWGSCTNELAAKEADAELVAITGRVFLLWRVLDVESRDTLRRWVTEMVCGMRRFVLEYPSGIRIATVAEFREYCYFVAGTVGHLLTELWHVHSVFVGERTYERLLADSEAFGEALQIVNTLKDVAWDVERENAVYVPAELLVACGSSHETILCEEYRSANRRALMPLMTLGQDDIERSLHYIEALPSAAMRVRLFCVLPVLFAVATMREIERTDDMLVSGSAVKISRAEVQALVVAGSASTLTNSSLRWLVDRVRERPFSLAFR